MEQDREVVILRTAMRGIREGHRGPVRCFQMWIAGATSRDLPALEARVTESPAPSMSPTPGDLGYELQPAEVAAWWCPFRASFNAADVMVSFQSAEVSSRLPENSHIVAKSAACL